MKIAFKQATKALFSNPIRTGLTTLGIVIGIATVILVLSAGAGFRSLIDSQVEELGSNAIYVETRVPPTTKSKASVTNSDTSRANSPVAITSLKNRDMKDVLKLANVVNAYGVVIGQKPVSFGDNVKNPLIFAASASRFDIDKGTLQFGRFFSQSEDSGAAQVCILGNTIAKDLFGDVNPVGKLIKVGEINFEVIGVYNQRGALSGMNDDENVLIPLATGQKKVLGIDYLSFLFVQIQNNDLAAATADDIKMVLRQNHNIKDPDKDDFQVTTQEQTMEIFNNIFNGITVLLIAIAAISLVVGGVGIMNIMYVAVTERTSEIGLKKALGATKTDILSEFLIEAILVTVLGGIVGILLGASLAWLVSFAANFSGMDWVFKVPIYSILIGFGVSAAIGLSFGVLPARSAAKLSPIDAMRAE